MHYLEALRLAHAILKPSNYCEIGCRHGNSLALSSCTTIGIDPEFDLRAAPTAQTQLFEMTSDDFFATHDLPQILGAPVDFAFIDGMHLAEYALRDFINLEKASHRNGVIAIDDILPDSMSLATRERRGLVWTGDVYRTILILGQYRPDLEIRTYTVHRKGFCLVSGLDPESRLLQERIAEIEAGIVAGKWLLASLEQLHEMTSPSSPERIALDLTEIARRRQTAAPAG